MSNSHLAVDLPFTTHDVINQPPALEPWNLYSSDMPLQELVQQGDTQWAQGVLNEYGRSAGDELFTAGFQANENPPRLHTHDRFGHRIDSVEFHPAYHQLMRSALKAGIHALPWANQNPDVHQVRMALAYLHNQAEAGTSCPVTMTFAAQPVIQQQSDIAEHWSAKIAHCDYDPSNRPWFEKSSLTIGMAMTEKQGGTDVRANSTRATPVAASGPGQHYKLIGHKWFCSAPMCDGFLMLAQTEQGLGCFLVPRWWEDGSKNPIHIQRLKEKQGNRANASSEIELCNASAWLIGDEGRGVATIIEMVALTRYDCMIGSAALMRQALTQSLHHCSWRKVLGKQLLTQPLMANVLADLALESEAALITAWRVAKALDSHSDQHEAGLIRIATAIGKYWICKRAPIQIGEAQECLGGVGYVEESILPRLYREAPVNSIWEGSGNVQCLDLMRALERNPETRSCLLDELHQARGLHPLFDQHLQQIGTLQNPEPGSSRVLMAQLATALQGSLLLRFGNPVSADAYCQARLAAPSLTFGMLPKGIDFQVIINRNLPKQEDNKSPAKKT